MKQIKALLLDAGGVLVRPVHGSWNIPARYREILGTAVPDITLDEYVHLCEDARIRYLNEDRLLTVAEEYICRKNYLAAAAKKLGISLSEMQLKDLAEDFTYDPARYIWYDDVRPVLSRLHKHYKIGILSDAMPTFKDFALEYDSGFGNFDAVSVSCLVGHTKPDPVMYRDILAKLNIPAENCLFTDDRVINLEGAMRLKIHAVQMCRDGLEPWNGPYVKDLTELERFMEALS